MTVIILIYIGYYFFDKRKKNTALKKEQFKINYIEPKKAG